MDPERFLDVDGIPYNGSFSILTEKREPVIETKKKSHVVFLPLIVFGTAFLCALVYGIVPVVNYWFYYLFKNQLWTILCIIDFIEIQELCLMDFPESLYIAAYVIGFLVPPCIHVICYYASGGYGSVLSDYGNTIAILCILVLYVVDVFTHPYSTTAAGGPINNGEIFDTFAASISVGEEIEEDTRLASVESKSDGNTVTLLPVMSEARKEWREEVRHRVLSKREEIRNPISGKSEYVSATCLPILPRFVFRSCGLTTGFVKGSRKLQLLLVFLYNTIFSAYFYFIRYFVDFFSGNISSREHVFLFLIYVVVGLAFSKVAKRLGILLDARKRFSSSMFFLAELTCLLYYYTFYRVLFESITGWGEFFFIEFIHLLSEWFLYPMRSTELTYSLLQLFEKKFNLPRGSVVSKGLNHSDWLHFISLEFGFRCTIMVATGLTVLLLSLAIDFVPWIHNSLRRDGREMELNSQLLSVAILMEIVNAAVMNRIYFMPLEISVVSKVQHCFSDLRFAFIATVTAAILFINPLYVFTTNNDFKK